MVVRTAIVIGLSPKTPVDADARLHVEHGAGRRELYHDGHQGEQRRDCDQRRRSDQEIHDPIHSLRAVTREYAFAVDGFDRIDGGDQPELDLTMYLTPPPWWSGCSGG